MDVVKRLREASGTYDVEGVHSALELEAADEIERLRAALCKVNDHNRRGWTILALAEEAAMLRAVLVQVHGFFQQMSYASYVGGFHGTKEWDYLTAKSDFYDVRDEVKAALGEEK